MLIGYVQGTYWLGAYCVLIGLSRDCNDVISAIPQLLIRPDHCHYLPANACAANFSSRASASSGSSFRPSKTPILTTLLERRSWSDALGATLLGTSSLQHCQWRWNADIAEFLAEHVLTCLATWRMRHSVSSFRDGQEGRRFGGVHSAQ